MYIHIYKRSIDVNRYPVQYFPTPNGKTLEGKSYVDLIVIARPGVYGYRFAYISPAVAPYPEVEVMSQIMIVPIEILVQPQHIRLSIVETDPSAIRFVWSLSQIVYAKSSLKRKLIKVLLSKSSNGPIVAYGNMESIRTYSRKDLCDQDSMPASNIGWIEPGIQVEAIAHGLLFRTTYFYTIQIDDYLSHEYILHTFTLKKLKNPFG